MARDSLRLVALACHNSKQLNQLNAIVSFPFRIFLITAYLFFVTAPKTHAQLLYTNNGSSITVTGYNGAISSLAIPSTLEGLPVVSIARNAFLGKSGLTTVSVPNLVTNIGAAAFGGCSNLTDITVDPANGWFSSLDGVLFDKSRTVLMQVPGDKAGAFNVLGSVTSIGDQALKACSKISSVVMPNTVTTVGSEAFANCTAMTNVTLSSAIRSLPFAVFSNCQALRNILLPNSVTNLDNYAFTFCGLTNVDIPQGVLSIGNVCFGNCADLVRVTIPASVVSIGVYAFSSCTALTGVFFEGDRPQIGTDAFINANQATIYYPVGAAGWTSSVAGKPAVVWNPVIVTNDSNFGVLSDQFGFQITGNAGVTVIVESTADLVNAVWTPIQTNSFTGTPLYFKDPFQPNSNRFFRLKSP